MSTLARHVALVLVLLTGAALVAAPAEAGKFKYKTKSGMVVYQNFVDDCPYNPRPAACRPKKPAPGEAPPLFQAAGLCAERRV